MKYLKTTVFLLSFVTFYLNNVKADIGAEFKNRILNSEYSYKYPFQERKNDIGIYFDFDWDKKNKEIIIKREDKNFPVIRYSLFNKNKIKKGLSVFKYDDNDLSKLSDEKIIELFRQNKEARILLSNNETLNLKPNIYDYNDIKLANFDLEFINNIDTNKGLLEISFEAAFINQRPELNKFARDLLTDDPISIDTTFGYYPILTPEFKEYKYDIDIRKGIKSSDVKDLPVSFTYDNNEVRTIRFESGIGQFRQQFDFKKFPFDNQKLIIPIISGATNTSNPENAWPKTGYGAVHFITPDKGAYLGLENYLNNVSENYLKEWQVKNVDIQSEEIVKENYYNKFLKKNVEYNENALNIIIDIERNSAHYIYKIIIPVFLILSVAWFVLWIPTYKLDARLTTSIVALLSLIAYNFVFSDDIPKLNYLTALDKYILLSYIFCSIPTFMSIGFSRFIVKNQRAVTLINKKLRTWLGLIYLLLTLQIFSF